MMTPIRKTYNNNRRGNNPSRRNDTSLLDVAVGDPTKIMSPSDTFQQQQRPSRGSLGDFFFGFLYEEDNNDFDGCYSISPTASTEEGEVSSSSTLRMLCSNRRLYWTLGVPLALSSACTATAATLVSAIALEIAATAAATPSGNGEQPQGAADLTPIISSSFFVTRATSAAVLGTALGKLVNGPVVDLVGARRTWFLYTMGMFGTLLLLAAAAPSSPSPSTVAFFSSSFFWIEFLYAIQWPSAIVILATHYPRRTATSTGKSYEVGIFVTSLSSRLGAVGGILGTSRLLALGLDWRWIAALASWCCAVAASIVYLYVQDSDRVRDEPQNPIDPRILSVWFPDQVKGRKPWTMSKILRLGLFVLQKNILPSVRHILGSATFWILAVAHTGATLVRTSQRVLPLYFIDTASSSSSNNASGSDPSVTVYHSTGIVLGLLLAGQYFARLPSAAERLRKRMVAKLYVLTIVACYVLALMAIPSVQWCLGMELVMLLQVSAVIVSGFGIAVPLFHIPSLVGATFGCDMGLFLAYADGVAYSFSSVAWTTIIIGNTGTNWTIIWATVALIVILSAILMVEFMEHYFCRHHRGGTYETIILA
jgi:MFS family permease